MPHGLCEGEESGCVCTGDGSCLSSVSLLLGWLLVSFLLALPLSGTTKPGCLLIHSFPVTQLLQDWCMPWQSMVPASPAQTMDVPSNVSSGTSSS